MWILVLIQIKVISRHEIIMNIHHRKYKTESMCRNVAIEYRHEYPRRYNFSRCVKEKK